MNLLEILGCMMIGSIALGLVWFGVIMWYGDEDTFTDFDGGH